MRNVPTGAGQKAHDTPGRQQKHAAGRKVLHPHPCGKVNLPGAKGEKTHGDDGDQGRSHRIRQIQLHTIDPDSGQLSFESVHNVQFSVGDMYEG